MGGGQMKGLKMIDVDFNRSGGKTTRTKATSMQKAVPIPIVSASSLLSNIRTKNIRTKKNKSTGLKPKANKKRGRNTSPSASATVASSSSVKSIQCPKCIYKCSRIGHLEIHMRTHTGERPYASQFCKHRSADKSNLKKHLLRRHKEEINHPMLQSAKKKQISRIARKSIFNKTKTKKTTTWCQCLSCHGIFWCITSFVHGFVCGFVRRHEHHVFVCHL